MADFPKITSPCPLRLAAMPRAGADFCGQCTRRVHNLDGMDGAQRRAFLAGCGDSKVCVAYTLPMPRRRAAGATLGAGLAVALAAAPALAADPLAPDVQSALQATVPAAAIEADIEYCPDSPSAGLGEFLDTITVGGIERADAAEWIDAESALAELPRAGADAFLAEEGVTFGPAPATEKL